MAGGKHVPEGKNEPLLKCTASDLNMKLRLCKYEGGNILSTVAHELGFVISTVNIIVKDAARLKGHVKITAMMKSIMMKRHEGAVSEIKKLLLMSVQPQMQEHVLNG
jgi:hypothetical protein